MTRVTGLIRRKGPRGPRAVRLPGVPVTVTTQDGRTWHRITCEHCLEMAFVPFEPRPGMRVYCRECHVRLQEQRKGA